MEIDEGTARGRGECVPYPRYGETPDSVLSQIANLRQRVSAELSREELQLALPAGAARNALDCALWDLDAKLSGLPVWKLADLSRPKPIVTAYTLSLDTPLNMGARAREHADKPLLKLKLGAQGASERVVAVRDQAPNTRIIVDANEAWTFDELRRLLPQFKRLGVELIEQPLPASQDSVLEGFERPIPLCADESFHHSADIERIRTCYDMVNIKLDKAGGLTEAMHCVHAAVAAGLTVMVGCMVGTSLAMAPATLIAQAAHVVDLDGPMLLARDREPGLTYANCKLEPPSSALWG